MSNIRAINRAIEEHIRHQREANPNRNCFGHYWEIVNGVLVNVGIMDPITDNLMPTEGIHSLLNIGLGPTAKEAGWYLGLYANAINPAAGWTAANIVATAGEIVSEDEGYEGATRPQWTPNVAGTNGVGTIDNVGQEAAFAIVSATSITIEGVFLVSSNVRGGTGGKLSSAARYTPTPRILANGDDYRLGYRTTITS